MEIIKKLGSSISNIGKAIEDFGSKPSSEETTIQLVDGLFSASLDKMKSQHAKWSKMYKWYKGKQWSNKIALYRAQVVYNKIYANIETILPIMTDGSPRITIKAGNSHATEPIVQIANQQLNHIWNKLLLNKMIQDWYVKDGLIYGDGVLKHGFDPTVKPFGEVFVTCPDLYFCFPDPTATDLFDLEYFIFAKPTNINIIRMTYKNGVQVQPDTDLIAQFKNHREDLDDAKLQAPVNQPVLYISREEEGTKKGEANQAVVMECWMRDYTLDKNGDLVYPYGRVITKAGKVVLDDKPNPYPYLMKKFNLLPPIVRFSSTILPHEFWQMSEVEQMIPMQQNINKRMSQTIEILNKFGNPNRIIDTNSGVDVDKLTNQSGLIIEKTAGSDVHIEQGAAPPAAAFMQIEMFDRQMDVLSGVNDMSRGKKPSGVTSGKAMEVIQESAQTRPRKRIRQLEDSLASLGRYLFEHIRHNYIEEREVKVVDKFGKVTFVKYDPKSIPAAAEIDIEVSVESSYLTSASNKLNKAFAFYDREVLDPQTLLEIGEFDNSEQILQRLAKWKSPVS